MLNTNTVSETVEAYVELTCTTLHELSLHPLSNTTYFLFFYFLY